MEDDDWKPSYFTVKKWSMALICLADIVIMAVYAVMGTYLANRYIHDFEDIKPHEAEYTKVWFWLRKKQSFLDKFQFRFLISLTWNFFC